jgi:hypothetical protein
MSNVQGGAAFRSQVLGQGPVSSASGAFAADTRTIFSVTGGQVLVTALWGVVTTAITVADTVKLSADPTAGDTVDLCTTGDLGTTDTTVGTVIGFRPATAAAPALVKGAPPLMPYVISTGDITQTTTGTGPDGAITWYATWVPLTEGAVLIAS